jgi:hypothetical protein
MLLLDRNPNSGGEDYAPRASSAPKPAAAAARSGDGSGGSSWDSRPGADLDDEIPF